MSGFETMYCTQHPNTIKQEQFKTHPSNESHKVGVYKSFFPATKGNDADDS